MLFCSPCVPKRHPLSPGLIESLSDSQTVMFWIHWRGWIRLNASTRCFGENLLNASPLQDRGSIAFNRTEVLFFFQHNERFENAANCNPSGIFPRLKHGVIARYRPAHAAGPLPAGDPDAARELVEAYEPHLRRMIRLRHPRQPAAAAVRLGGYLPVGDGEFLRAA